MDYRQLIDSMTPELYRRLQRALETGRWPDGRALTAEQRQHSMRAVIAWGEAHLPPEQRVGYIDRGRKTGGCPDGEADAEQPLAWKD
jgi:uncharacterized protein YeaC (DUF1315 family)